MPRLLLVDVVDQRFPRPLAAAGVHVDLDEPVDRVDGRVGIGHPRDVVGAPVLHAASAVEPHQRLDRRRHRRRRAGARRLEMRDDAGDRLAVPAVDPVHLLAQDPVALHETRIQLVALHEAVEVGHPHALVEIVGAGREDVVAGRRRLAGHHGGGGRIEEQRPQPIEQAVERFAARQREHRAVARGLVQRLGHDLRSETQDELARGQTVVGPAVQPAQFRVAPKLAGDLRREAVGVPQQALERVAEQQPLRAPLVPVDVAAGERRFVQVPDQSLLINRQRRESVRVVLDDGRIVDAFEEVGTFGDHDRLAWATGASIVAAGLKPPGPTVTHGSSGRPDFRSRAQAAVGRTFRSGEHSRELKPAHSIVTVSFIAGMWARHPGFCSIACFSVVIAASSPWTR